MGFLKGAYQVVTILAVRAGLFLFFVGARPLSHRKMHFFCCRIDPNLFKAVFEALNVAILALALYPTRHCQLLPPPVEISMIVIGLVIAITPPAMLLYELLGMLVVCLRRKVCRHNIRRFDFGGGRGMLALGLKNNDGQKRQESVPTKTKLKRVNMRRRLRVKLQSVYHSNSLFANVSKSSSVAPVSGDATDRQKNNDEIEIMPFDNLFQEEQENEIVELFMANNV